MRAGHLPLRWPLLQPSVAWLSRLHGFEHCVSGPFRPYHCCAPTIIQGGHMKAQTSKPVVLHDGEGDATWFIGTLMTRKAGATDGVGGVAFLDQLAPAGFGPPLHVHRREDEGFYILEGQVDFVCDGQTFHLSPGSWVLLTRDVACEV